MPIIRDRQACCNEMNPRLQVISPCFQGDWIYCRISTKLAVGLTLEEIPYWKGGTLDKYEPSEDYLVVKFPQGPLKISGGRQAGHTDDGCRRGDEYWQELP